MNKILQKSWSAALVLLLLLGCRPAPELVKTDATNIPVAGADTLQGDPEVQEMIAPYKQNLDAGMNEVLVISDKPITNNQPEGRLGNLVADIVYEKGKEKYHPKDGVGIDFCLINNGGLRTSLPQGEITRGKVFELMPFENEIVIITFSGEKTQQLFDYLVAVGGQPVSNLQLTIQPDSSYSAKIGGQPFDVKKKYKVATSDYLANGGDKMNFFLQPLHYEGTGYKIRDAIIDYFIEMNEEGKTLNPQLEGRIEYAE